MIKTLLTLKMIVSQNLGRIWLASKVSFIQKLLTDPINESLFLRPADNNEVLKEINQFKDKITIDTRV